MIIDKIHTIRLTPVEGESKEIIKRFCPFSGINKCELVNIDCKYNLTHTAVPDECPLLKGPVITSVELQQPRENDGGS